MLRQAKINLPKINTNVALTPKPKPKLLTIKIAPEDMARLERYAKTHKTNMSQVVRAILLTTLEQAGF